VIYELFFLGFVILIGFAGQLFFRKTKIPELLFLVTFGLFVGPGSGLLFGESLVPAEPFKNIMGWVTTVALIVILLESGFEFDITEFAYTFSRTTFFTVITFALTTVLVSLFMRIVVGWPLLTALLMGAVSSGTTTITVSHLVKPLDIKENVKQLLVLESIINDITIVTGGVIIIQFIKAEEITAISLQMITSTVFGSIVVAVAGGVIFFLFWLITLDFIKLDLDKRDVTEEGERKRYSVKMSLKQLKVENILRRVNLRDMKMNIPVLDKQMEEENLKGVNLGELEFVETSPLKFVYTLGLLFVMYDAIEFLNGSGPIAVLIFSLLVGNSEKVIRAGNVNNILKVLGFRGDIGEKSRSAEESIKIVLQDVSFFVRAFFFVSLGILFDPSIVNGEILSILAGILIFMVVGRYISSKILALRYRDFSQYSKIIAVMLPRGFTATVVAFLPGGQGVDVPGFTEIILLMVFVTTVIAIIGAAVYARVYPEGGIAG